MNWYTYIEHKIIYKCTRYCGTYVLCYIKYKHGTNQTEYDKL